jgi:hypothetical protein
VIAGSALEFHWAILQIHAETSSRCRLSYARTFLRELPRNRDDSRFRAGYPGLHVPITRKTGAN